MSIPGSASPLFFKAAAADAAAYQIDRSLRFNSADTAHLNRTPSSAGNRKTFTFSAWVKLSELGTGFYTIFQAGSDDFRISSNAIGLNNSGTGLTASTAVLRDPSAWYHVVLAVDNTQSSNRTKIYVNSEIVAQGNTYSLNEDTPYNNTVAHYIGKNPDASGREFDGYLAEIHFVDGTRLEPTDFGQYDDNNVWQPKAYSGSYGTNGFYLKLADNSSNASLGTDSSGNGNTWTVNNLVATAGLATAAQGFDVVTWTANGSNQSITGLGFQPDFIWAKSRNTDNTPHLLVDSVRGASQSLSTHTSSAEEDYSGISGVISAFNSDGFDTGGNSDIATNGRTFVAWCWKAGGTAVSNTDGSITSSVSANTTYGFSIVSYTGNGSDATIGHGLSSAPKWIIKKFRSASSSWDVYHESVGAGKRLVLNSAATEASTSSYQNVNSSTFDVHAGNNDNGVSMIAYCWSEVSGFSKFGEYSGGCTSSVTVTTGFKPKFVIIKGKDVDSSPSGYRGWGMYQEPVTSQQLMAHCSGGEGVRGNCGTGSDKRDIQANVVFNNDGFTVDNCWFEQNDDTSGNKYIYMAFADKPPGEIIDSLIDTPTNYEADSGNNGGNYATLNPLAKGSDATLSNGNLDVSYSTGSTRGLTTATVGMSSGKWYWEVTFTASSVTNTNGAVGITTTETGGTNYPGHQSTSWGYLGDGNKYNNGSGSSYGSTYGANDVIGVAFDADGGNLYFYKNGTAQNSGTAAYTGLTSGPYFAAVGDGSTNDTFSASFNFGQRPFAISSVPTGYKSLCTQNLADPTIADGSTAFAATTYTGNGASSRAITGVGHSPDFFWVKSRGAARPHNLQDSVRGVGNYLISNTTNAEGTGLNDGLISLDSDGFTIGNNAVYNNNSEAYVAWTWDAGTSTASNTDGSITSSVRANASAGFSIVGWSGHGSGSATVGHGLNAAPELIILKGRTNTGAWVVGSDYIGWGNRLELNTTSASSSASADFNSTAPTSSVFTVGSNQGSGNKIAYCFAPVEGYSAFGSYTGNGSTDGPFVFTGFRVKWLMIKRDGEGDWRIWDTSRDPVNVADNKLYPNKSDAETGSSDTNEVDILSNGFKLRSSVSEGNFSGNTYVYAAFAEHPFKTSRAR